MGLCILNINILGLGSEKDEKDEQSVMGKEKKILGTKEKKEALDCVQKNLPPYNKKKKREKKRESIRRWEGK